MDNFSVIYKILKAFEKAMDLEEFDIKQISPDVLKISENRWLRIMEMLIGEGYITGVLIEHFMAGDKISANNPRITLKGLEYLNENSFMKKACEVAKGIMDIIS
ncbi:MAG: YjcQ family protein [Bacteroides sp.]|nr:YjcQ family protein [Bacteroides sp.]